MKFFKNLDGIRIVSTSILAEAKYIKPITQAAEKGDISLEKELIVKATKEWTNKVLKAMKMEINVINGELLPQDGPVLYIANHQSYADIFILIHAIPHQIGFIAKSDLKKIPLFRGWVERIRSVYIDRKDIRSSLKSINTGAELLKQGFSLVIFPEGTRSQKREMAHFKPGALKLATKANARIIPVTLDGGYKTFEEKGEITKGVHIDMMVHPHIDTADLTREELASLTNRVEDIIRKGLDTINDMKNNS